MATAYRIMVPEYHVRLRWTPDMIGIGDNRSTRHCAVGDCCSADRATRSNDRGDRMAHTKTMPRTSFCFLLDRGAPVHIPALGRDGERR